ncbi:MAG: pseudaminic acid cytidylyltransferase [Spirosoma sp.]|uniref:pseudaminic acid cytidylyltransferase n=1 Tax=Spirosoma sp. TaxID=1899569 RepID=UPI0009616D69|nr:pseudaminic acid cytidylyltransferase [Spirosoma sp.]MBN8826998.1 pseudaminic acid cytidylyltransferase [Spirosoma sp.]MBN8834478.1 pseudaminic acid cytidylyltransferase [Sphingobacteriales bacterium]OJW08937.1 MAG: pseudaminic acid cytidylyltransferase [Sphingobacteriales bacterium 39-19]
MSSLQNNIAIIPARGGSKRIPGKNIKLFLGKPIIAYSIEIAIQSGLFDYVMVSTDDDEIAKIAKQSGAEVPFMRSKESATDFASTADVLVEVLDKLNEKGMQFNNSCCIYPTAPLITMQTLKEAYCLLNDKGYKSVLPVCNFSYPIQRALEINNDSKIMFVNPENSNTRSQDLQARYHDAGQFYWMNTQLFLEEKKLITENTGAIILNELQVQDIDNETDWKLAELKYKLSNNIE